MAVVRPRVIKQCSEEGYGVTSVLRVAYPRRWGSPSFKAVVDLLEAVDRETKTTRRPVHPRVGRLVRRLGFVGQSLNSEVILVPLMGPRFDILAAASLHGRPLIYAWDVWEPDIEAWAYAIRSSRCCGLICSSKIASNKLDSLGLGVPIYYVPEGVVVDRFNGSKRLEMRTIDVLELGRRHPAWHDAVVKAVDLKSVTMVYEEPVGQIVFASDDQFRSGISDSKISVCFPRSMTHSGSAGSFEALTQRYLESIAAGCLVVGHAPADLIELFGDSPVVGVDLANPGRQLEGILATIDDYQEFVTRNRERLRDVGGWDVRAREILRIADEVRANA